MMIEKTFDTGSIRLNYAEGAANGPPLLLLHGLGVRWQGFLPIIPELENSRHLFALDFRGHGKSDRAPSYRLHDNLPDLISFIEKGLPAPVAIFGHSYGGMISVMLAAQRPDLVKALVIGDSIIAQDQVITFSETQRETTTLWREWARGKTVEEIKAELQNQLIAIPGRPEPVPAHQVFGADHPHFRFMAKSFSQVDPEVMTANLELVKETYAEYQPENYYSKIECPVLLLQANPALGGLMRDEDVRLAVDLIPNARHAYFEKAGHYLYLNDKETVVNSIRAFLAEMVD